MDLLGGHGPPTWALFSKNVCKNKRIGSHRGGGVRPARPLDPPMESTYQGILEKVKDILGAWKNRELSLMGH